MNNDIRPSTQTDSEVIALLIGYFLDQGEPIVEAIKKTCLKLIGSYNFALVYSADAKSIYAVRNSG